MSEERNEEMLDQDGMTMNLELEDGTQVTCQVAGVFEADGQAYIGLIPLGADNVLLYRYQERENDEVELADVESDEEFQRASDVFWEVFGEEEFGK